jgi:hypothetical protein
MVGAMNGISIRAARTGEATRTPLPQKVTATTFPNRQRNLKRLGKHCCCHLIPLRRLNSPRRSGIVNQLIAGLRNLCASAHKLVDHRIMKARAKKFKPPIFLI